MSASNVVAASAAPILSVPCGPTLDQGRPVASSDGAQAVAVVPPALAPPAKEPVKPSPPPLPQRRRSARLSQAAPPARKPGPSRVHASKSADKASSTDQAGAARPPVQVLASDAPTPNPTQKIFRTPKRPRIESRTAAAGLGVAPATPSALPLVGRPRRTLSDPTVPASSAQGGAASFFAELRRVHGAQGAVGALAKFGMRLRAGNDAARRPTWAAPGAAPRQRAATEPPLLAAPMTMFSRGCAHEAQPAVEAAAAACPSPACAPPVGAEGDLAAAPTAPTATRPPLAAILPKPHPANLDVAHLDNAARLLPWVRERFGPQDVKALWHAWLRTQAARHQDTADDPVDAAASLFLRLCGAAHAAGTPRLFTQTLPRGLAIARERLAQAQQAVDALAEHSWDPVRDCACRRDGETSSLAVRLFGLQLELLHLRLELHLGSVEAPDAQLRLCQARRLAVEMHAAAEERGIRAEEGTHGRGTPSGRAPVLVSLVLVMQRLRDEVAAAQRAEWTTLLGLLKNATRVVDAHPEIGVAVQHQAHRALRQRLTAPATSGEQTPVVVPG